MSKKPNSWKSSFNSNYSNISNKSDSVYKTEKYKHGEFKGEFKKGLKDGKDIMYYNKDMPMMKIGKMEKEIEWGIFQNK